MDDDDFTPEMLAKKRAQRQQEAKAANEAALAADPEMAAILAESKAVQQDTLSSTQNSLRTIKETITVADKTSGTLKQQGAQLERIEEKAQTADVNATDSYQSARELHKYKGFIPVSVKNALTGGKKRDEDSRLAKATKALDKEEGRVERESQQHKPTLAGTPKTAADYGGDETEAAINRNLDEMSAGLDHLNVQASEMGLELKKQNVTLKRIEATSEHTDYTLKSADRKIQEFM